MIWGTLAKVAATIGKGIYYALGGIQAAGELIGAGKKLAKEARRGKLPHRVDQTDPIPLTRKSPRAPR